MGHVDYASITEEHPTTIPYEMHDVEFVPRWQNGTKSTAFPCLHRFSDSDCLRNMKVNLEGEEFVIRGNVTSVGPLFNSKATDFSAPSMLTAADISGTEGDNNNFQLAHAIPYINNVQTAQTSYVTGQQMDVSFKIDNWQFYYAVYKETMLKNLFVTFDHGQTRQSITNATMKNGVVTASVKAPETTGHMCIEIGVVANDWTHFAFQTTEYYPAAAYTYVDITEGTPAFVPIALMTMGGVPDVIHYRNEDMNRQYTAYAAITPATATYQGGKWTSSRPEVLTIDEKTGAITFKEENPEMPWFYIYHQSGKTTLTFVSDEYDYRVSQGETPNVADFTISKEVTLLPDVPHSMVFYYSDRRQDVYGDSRDVVVDFKIDADDSWILQADKTVTLTIEAKDGTQRTLTYNINDLRSERDEKNNLHVYVPFTLTDHEFSLMERHGATTDIVWTVKVSISLPFVNTIDTELTYDLSTYRYINYAYDPVVVDEWKRLFPYQRDIIKGQTDYVIAHAYNLPKDYFNVQMHIMGDTNWKGSGDYWMQTLRYEYWESTSGIGNKPDWLQLIDRGDGYYDARITIPVESTGFQGDMVPLQFFVGAGNSKTSSTYKPNCYIHYNVLKKDRLHYYTQRPYCDDDNALHEVAENDVMELNDDAALAAFNSFLNSQGQQAGSDELLGQIAKFRKSHILLFGNVFKKDNTSTTTFFGNDGIFLNGGYWLPRQTEMKITGGVYGQDTLRSNMQAGVYFPMTDATYTIILHNKVFNIDRVIHYTTHALPAEHIYAYHNTVPFYAVKKNQGSTTYSSSLNLVYGTKGGETKNVKRSGTGLRTWFYEPDDIVCFNTVDDLGNLNYGSEGFYRGFADNYTEPTFFPVGVYGVIDFDDDVDKMAYSLPNMQFDQGDEVHLTLHNLLGDPVTTAHVNYVAVDADGNPTGQNGRANATADGKVVVPFSTVVNDKQTGSLYMEVVADGYEPRFYKYNIVDQSYRHPFNSVPNNDVDLVLETPEQTTTRCSRADLMHVVEANADTTAVTFNIVDMTAYNLMDRIGYKEEGPLGGMKSIYGIRNNNGAYSYERRWEGEKFAQLGVTLRKNSAVDYSQLRLTGFGNLKDCTPTAMKVITLAEFPGFEHDYVDATFDVVGFVPNEKMAIPVLKVGDTDLAQLPKLHNEEIDMVAIADNMDIKLRTNPDFDMGQIGPQSQEQGCDLEENAQLFDGIDFDFPDVMGFQFQVKKVGNYFQVRGVYSKNFLPGGDEAEMATDLVDKLKDSANQFDRLYKDCVNSCTGQSEIGDDDGFDFMADHDQLFGSNDAFVGIRAFLSGIAYLGPDGEFMVNFHDGGIKLEASAEYTHNVNFFIGAFGAKLSAELSTTLKLINRKADTGDVYHFGLDVMVETAVRGEIVAWAKGGLNILNLVKAEVGVRGGASVGYKSAISYPLIDHPKSGYYTGHQIDLRSGMFVYADARFLWWRKHWEWWLFKYRKTWCFPDTRYNPYSDKFEQGPSIFSARAMGSRGWKRVKPRRVVGAGYMLMNDVTGIASPRIFNHGNSLIYNKLNTPGDYNDDRLMMFDLTTKQDADINAAATGAAFNFDVAERGDKGIVAFEQYNSSTLTKAEVEGSTELDDMNQMSQNVGVQASLWDGSSWQTTKLSADGVANLNPRAAMQADGHAAVAWLSGTPKGTAADSEGERRQYIDGEYLLSRYDGTSWSEPIKLANLRQSFTVSDHQMVMSGDSILIYLEHRDEINSPENPYIDCIAVTPDDKVSFLPSVERGRNPQIARVGNVNLVAYLTERPDSVQDIRLRTVDMKNTTVATTDGYALMGKRGVMSFKLSATENAKTFDDVALIWSQSRIAPTSQDDETKTELWLCAGRVGKTSNSIYVSYPEKIVKIPEDFAASSFDGYIDNDSLHVVYALSDINDGTAVMQNGVKFTNGIRVKNVSIAAANASSPGNIPFKVSVLNTGYAPMTSATVNIGTSDVVFNDMNVMPGETTELSGTFAIDSDNYDGQEDVTVTAGFGIVNVAMAPRRSATDPKNTAAESLTCDVKATDLSCTVLSSRIRDKKNTVIAKITNCSPLPMLSGQTVTAGLYASLTDEEPISGTSLVTIPVSDLYDATNSTPLTKVVKMQVENLAEDQQAFIKITVKDNNQNVADVCPENNHVPVQLYAEDGNIMTLLGDANSDGAVTITDAVAIVNSILGNTSKKFNAIAADVNRDNGITITDAVGVVNIILDSSGSAPKLDLPKPESMGEPE